MTTFNVLAAVVELVDAPDEETAKSLLRQRLTLAGFDLYEGQPLDAFESDVSALGPASLSVEHDHHYGGQHLIHSHPGGDQAHGYYEHPEDGSRRTLDSLAAGAALRVDPRVGGR